MAVDIGILLITLVIGVAIAGLVWSLTRRSTESNKKSRVEEPVTAEKQEKKQDVAKPKKKVPVHLGKDSKATFTHSWLLTTLKGHTGSITDMDFSANEKHLATCSEDRSVMLWKLKLGNLDKNVVELNMKDIRTVRTVVQYDTASLVRWSPDSKALLIVRALGNNIEIYKVTKKPDGDMPCVQASHEFPKTRETDLMTIDVASTGRFILTCTPKNELDILDLKGNILSSIATNVMETYCAKISPDGRFVACSGFTPDVKVWEVLFTKSGDFDKVNKAFELTGHTSGIYSFDFTPDSHLMATVSKDGTWKVYNTNIEYKQGQRATVLMAGKWKNSSQSAKIALAPDGRVVAIACESSIYFYSVLNGEPCGQIDNAHSAPIKCVRFDASSRFLLSTGDKYVRVFHNVPGFNVAIADLESKLKKATSNAMRERCQQQINDYQSLVSLVEQ